MKNLAVILGLLLFSAPLLFADQKSADQKSSKKVTKSDQKTSSTSKRTVSTKQTVQTTVPAYERGGRETDRASYANTGTSTPGAFTGELSLSKQDRALMRGEEEPAPAPTRDLADLPPGAGVQSGTEMRDGGATSSSRTGTGAYLTGR
jgi:hypothetical protein